MLFLSSLDGRFPFLNNPPYCRLIGLKKRPHNDESDERAVSFRNGMVKDSRPYWVENNGSFLNKNSLERRGGTWLEVLRRRNGLLEAWHLTGSTPNRRRVSRFHGAYGAQ